jgi:hypothetical protein
MADLCPECDYQTDVPLELQEHVAEVHGQMTREEARRVLNEAADLVIEEMGWGNDATREADAVNLLVNVFGTMLDNPDTTVDEVMDANYESGAEAVRSWWPGWGRQD